MSPEETKKSQIARRHHFNPRCWLSGFTNTGENTGVLWVTDLREQRQWKCNPRGTGFEQDLYRLDDSSGLDPMAAENVFGMVEDMTAPVLRDLFQHPRCPVGEDLEKLLWLIALQYVRVPTFRPWALGHTRAASEQWISAALVDPETWKLKLEEAGLSADQSGASYEKMLPFRDDITANGSYSLSAPNDWYVLRGFDAAVRLIVPALKNRYWNAMISPSGSFIASDSPVAMDGHSGSQVGFVNADVVCFPVNKHLSLIGTPSRSWFPHTNRNVIAHQNTFTMLSAGRRLYSAEPDFCWKDHRAKYQTDYTLFSKELVLNGDREAFN